MKFVKILIFFSSCVIFQIQFTQIPQISWQMIPYWQKENGKKIRRARNTSVFLSSRDQRRNLIAGTTRGAELITVEYMQKPQEGGRKGCFRALAIGGNGNGCGGFGIGKADDADLAVELAVRFTRRNPFFVERFQGNSLSHDLVGKHNSCIVRLRSSCNGLRGNELVSSILLHMGITHCNSKSHGNRNDFNLVYATFKALMTHESLEDIALKRGKRLINIERARRMQV
ncbi:MAG: hypothetical protein M1113_05790 [Candidatus Thermoplasmatota archaeon]|nr:hypothetical protein [Candidatus Thermoplasmatota archaeon]